MCNNLLRFKKSKKKSNKAQTPKLIVFEPNVLLHSVDDISFEKQTFTTTNENDDVPTHTVDIQWSVINGVLEIVLHEQPSLPTNNNECCVLP